MISAVSSGPWRSPAPRVLFISRAQTMSSSGVIPMKLPITRATTGWATSLTRSHSSRPSSRSRTPDRDRADRVLVLGDPLRGEAALEERLEPVVLGRVHADEHRLDQLQRHDRVGERGDPAPLGRVGLPVAADRVDVVGEGHRPEAVLLRVLGDPLGPVDRTLAAHALEQLVGRPVEPALAVADQDLVQRLLGRSARRARSRSRSSGVPSRSPGGHPGANQAAASSDVSNTWVTRPEGIATSATTNASAIATAIP